MDIDPHMFERDVGFETGVGGMDLELFEINTADEVNLFLPDFFAMNNVSPTSTDAPCTPHEPESNRFGSNKRKLVRSVSEWTTPRQSGRKVPVVKRIKSASTTPQNGNSQRFFVTPTASIEDDNARKVDETMIAKKVTQMIFAFPPIEDARDKWINLLNHCTLWQHLLPVLSLSACDRMMSIINTCTLKDQGRVSADAVKAIFSGRNQNLDDASMAELTEVYWTCRLELESQNPLFHSMRLSLAQFRDKYGLDDTNSLTADEVDLAKGFCNALRVGLCILPAKLNKYRLVRMAFRVAGYDTATYCSRSGAKGKFHEFLTETVYDAESVGDTSVQNRKDFAEIVAANGLKAMW